MGKHSTRECTYWIQLWTEIDAFNSGREDMGAKQKTLCLSEKSFRSPEHDMKGNICYFQNLIIRGPAIKIEKRGYTKIIRVLTGLTTTVTTVHNQLT